VYLYRRIERGHLQVVDDQVGAPTSAELLADVTAHCAVAMRRNPAAHPSGLCHVTAAGFTSSHEYARFVVESAIAHGVSLKLNPERIQSVSSSANRSAALRPLNSRFSTKKLRCVFGLGMPHWKVHARRVVRELSMFESK
jgi:dTDP-4-dehydrorhamnose reductase